MTGVSKFSKVSIFSDLNHLLDITTSKSFSTLLGYTQSEIEHYFAERFDEMKSEYPDIMEKTKEWYNGYSWDGKNFVYNPFSLLCFLQEKEFNNFWFSTGTPTFLLKLMKEQSVDDVDFQNVHVSGIALDKFEIADLDLIPLLFQTGYLTIKHKDKATGFFKLELPNREVANAFSTHLLSVLNEKPLSKTNMLLYEMSMLLGDGKIDVFIDKLKYVYKGIAYQNIEDKESYYHSLFYLVVRLLGYIIKSEIPTSDGRVDAIIEAKDYVYIIEFKLHSAEEALAQIKEKQYHLPYLNSDKKIKLIGIGFDTEAKTIGNYLVEKVSGQ